MDPWEVDPPARLPARTGPPARHGRRRSSPRRTRRRQVLSADCFSAFEEVGLDNEDAVRATGRRFRDTVLSLGGGVAPAKVFETFRGRQPKPDALLRHSGLVAGSA